MDRMGKVGRKVVNVNIIYYRPTCFSYKVLYKRISTNRHTNTNETFRTEKSKGDIAAKLSQCRAGRNDAVRHIENSLLGGALGEDGCLLRH